MQDTAKIVGYASFWHHSNTSVEVPSPVFCFAMLQDILMLPTPTSTCCLSYTNKPININAHNFNRYNMTILIANNNYSPNMNKSSRPISPTPPYLTPTKKNNTKKVTFCEITEEIYYESDTDHSMFYTKYDYEEMRQQRYNDIADMHSFQFSVEENRVFFNEDKCVLNGLENFLTPELYMKSLRRKRSYVHVVLKEYKRQSKAGVYDVEKLANVAKLKSLWSTRRAFRIGCHQSKNSVGARAA